MTTRAIIDGLMGTSGSKVFLTGVEEVAQNIETRLKWFYGEAFLDTRNGTPIFQTILGKSNGQEREAAIKKVILETDDVTKLTEFKMEEQNHNLIVTGSVLTSFSADTVSFSVSI